MRIELLFLMGLLCLSTSFAWSCETHQQLCDAANLSDLDCCRADREKIPGMTLHHCSNNATRCEARIAAESYAKQPDIVAHLIADSYSPVHWYVFTDECHSKYESAVSKLDWTVGGNLTMNCELKNGSNIDIVWNAQMMQDIVYALNNNATIQPLSHQWGDNAYSLEDWLNEIINFFTNYFRM